MALGAFDILPASARTLRRIDEFELGRLVFQGRTSRVWQAKDCLCGGQVILKLYRKKYLTPLNRSQVAREAQLHSRLSHRGIVDLHACFEDDSNVYFVEERADGDLWQQLGKGSSNRSLSEERAKAEVIIPVLQVLEYLHEKGIAHRDVKPENILITSSGVKLADFGLAIDVRHERPVTRLGTLDYTAPEVIVCRPKTLPDQNKETSAGYTTQVDVWAIGILAYELLIGNAPFQRSSRMATAQSILRSEPVLPVWISRNARAFIEAALNKDPCKRPTASQLLQHAWLQPNASSDLAAAEAPHSPRRRMNAASGQLPAAVPEIHSPATPLFHSPHLRMDVLCRAGQVPSYKEHAVATFSMHTSMDSLPSCSSGASASGSKPQSPVSVLPGGAGAADQRISALHMLLALPSKPRSSPLLCGTQLAASTVSPRLARTCGLRGGPSSDPQLRKFPSWAAAPGHTGCSGSGGSGPNARPLISDCFDAAAQDLTRPEGRIGPSSSPSMGSRPWRPQLATPNALWAASSLPAYQQVPTPLPLALHAKTPTAALPCLTSAALPSPRYDTECPTMLARMSRISKTRAMPGDLGLQPQAAAPGPLRALVRSGSVEFSPAQQHLQVLSRSGTRGPYNRMLSMPAAAQPAGRAPVAAG